MPENLDLVKSSDPDPLPRIRHLAASLRAAGQSAGGICQTIGRELAKAEVARPTAQDIVRELPGLANYSVLADFDRRMQAALKEYGEELARGILETDFDTNAPPVRPTPLEVTRQRRGRALAQIVTRHEGELRPAVVKLLAPAVSEQIAAEVPPLIDAKLAEHELRTKKGGK